MSGVLRYTIVVRDPDNLTPVALLAGQPVPEWAQDLVADEDYIDAGGESGIPAKTGRGSGKEAWADYAKTLDVAVPVDATRDDIIAALTAAGKPTE